jgi:hypothetical protein
VLQAVAEREQLLAVAAQLTGQLGGGDPLSDPAEDQDQFGGRPPGPLQEGAGEGVEHPVAGRAAIVEHRVAVAAMDGQVLTRGAPRAGESTGVQPIDEPPIAGALVHQFGEREVHDSLPIDPMSPPVISRVRRRRVKTLPPTSRVIQKSSDRDSVAL